MLKSVNISSRVKGGRREGLELVQGPGRPNAGPLTAHIPIQKEHEEESFSVTSNRWRETTVLLNQYRLLTGAEEGSSSTVWAYLHQGFGSAIESLWIVQSVVGYS